MKSPPAVNFGVITLNPAFDVTLTVTGPLCPGKVHPVAAEKTSPAGKGTNVARLIAARGFRVACGGLCGRSEIREFESSLPEGVCVCLQGIDSKTRRNLTLLTGNGEYKINRPGFPDIEYSEALIERVLRPVVEQSEVVILSGSLPSRFPSETYAVILHKLRQQGKKAVLDTSGEALVHALREARPDVIKPNGEESQTLLGRSLHGPADMARAVRELLALAPVVVLSDGPRGAWFGESASASVRHATSPEVVKRDSTAAGDCLLGQFCTDFFSTGLTPRTIARAVAAGAAAAERSGTECPAPDRIDDLAEKCVITEHGRKNDA